MAVLLEECSDIEVPWYCALKMCSLVKFNVSEQHIASYLQVLRISQEIHQLKAGSMPSSYYTPLYPRNRTLLLLLLYNFYWLKSTGASICKKGGLYEGGVNLKVQHQLTSAYLLQKINK
jgi:hypothetical protein